MYLSVTAFLNAEWGGRSCSYVELLSEQMFWPGKDVIRSSWKGTNSLLDADLISLTSEKAHLEGGIEVVEFYAACSLVPDNGKE